VIFLAGGIKKRQHKDIDRAKMRWADYKTGKKKET
jgi:putative component of toxin-antitoxin plasmid stabilization module